MHTNRIQRQPVTPTAVDTQHVQQIRAYRYGVTDAAFTTHRRWVGLSQTTDTDRPAEQSLLGWYRRGWRDGVTMSRIIRTRCGDKAVSVLGRWCMELLNWSASGLDEFSLPPVPTEVE